MDKKLIIKTVDITTKIEHTSSIECTKCEGVAAYDSDDFSRSDIVHKLLDAGWLATDGNTYCPLCAKKFKLK